jgi:hypothetical protein
MSSRFELPASSKNEFGVPLTDEQLKYLRLSGFPTFDQFQKEPDKYRGGWEEIFACIENGPDILRNATKGKHVLKVVGRRVESIGQMIRVARDMGFDLKKMTFEVNLEKASGGKFVHHVNLVPDKSLLAAEKGLNAP